jgi:putative phosphoribosyl transferase
VTAPTLLIVGGDDRSVLHLNYEAAASLCCPNELTIVPPRPICSPERSSAAELAVDWFVEHLPPSAATSPS